MILSLGEVGDNLRTSQAAADRARQLADALPDSSEEKQRWLQVAKLNRKWHDQLSQAVSNADKEGRTLF